MSKSEPQRTVSERVRGLPDVVKQALGAALGKKAQHPLVLDLRKGPAFTDFFVICTGQNVRQVRAIADAIEEALRRTGLKPSHVEGYERSEWVLLDYFDLIVHVFTPDTREFYGLERLWGSAERLDVSDADFA
jgi:ribosome-associated protein